MTDQIDIKVSEDLVKGILESKVQAAITEALSKDQGIVESVVHAALSCKVNADGKRSTYDSENKFTYLDALCKKTIQAAAESAIKKWAEERQKSLEAEFLKQLQTKKTSSMIVKACVSGLVEATKSKWNFSVNFPSE